MTKPIAAILSALVVAALLAGPASAAKNRPTYVRADSAPYEAAGNIYVSDSLYAMGRSVVLGESASITTTSTDRFASITLVDDSGLQVGGIYSLQEGEGSQGFCGSIDNIPVIPRMPMRIWVAEGACGATSAPSIATSGTIEVKLSNHRF